MRLGHRRRLQARVGFRHLCYLKGIRVPVGAAESYRALAAFRDSPACADLARPAGGMARPPVHAVVVASCSTPLLLPPPSPATGTPALQLCAPAAGAPASASASGPLPHGAGPAVATQSPLASGSLPHGTKPAFDSPAPLMPSLYWMERAPLGGRLPARAALPAALGTPPPGPTD